MTFQKFLSIVIVCQLASIGLKAQQTTEDYYNLYGESKLRLTFGGNFLDMGEINAAFSDAGINSLNEGKLEGGIEYGDFIYKKLFMSGGVAYSEITSAPDGGENYNSKVRGYGIHFTTHYLWVDRRITLSPFFGCHYDRYFMTIEQNVSSLSNIRTNLDNRTLVVPLIISARLGVNIGVKVNSQDKPSVVPPEIGLTLGYTLGFNEAIETRTGIPLSEEFRPSGLFVGIYIDL